MSHSRGRGFWRLILCHPEPERCNVTFLSAIAHTSWGPAAVMRSRLSSRDTRTIGRSAIVQVVPFQWIAYAYHPPS
jgi:hypothetical protein